MYYEIGYCIGLGKSLAPVLNVSFANASTDIQKDGLFDIINYASYENSAQLAALMATLPVHSFARLRRQATQQSAANILFECIPQN